MPATGPAAALTRPRRLRPGDRVGVVAPSGPVPRERLEAGVAVLREWGLEPVVGAHVLEPHPTLGHLSSADEHRARDLEDAWCDPSVAGVVPARGGYGMQRVLDLLDWDRMRAAGPKVFVGYSDLTVLHEAFAQRVGLATLHGPMAATASFLDDEATRDHLRRSLFTPESVLRIGPGDGARTLVPGRAHGVTLGGNLSLLAAERGTPGARPCAAGGILLLEDIDQPPYSIDRLLTQLLRSGWFDGVAGIALGSWTACGEPEEVGVVLRERLEPLGVPVVEDLCFGHGPSTPTLPLGVPAVLDADARTLTYDEPGLL
ncbi:peptidase U61 [Streptomyces abyssalis]|uniref:Peptidase U61 n=1 Tax=Streptomyces abyssalis TaxID=933944 RepID=A0A1E7JTK5_9ACTN|nr:peptidase U61 [Streptomyces abyssalis]OEU94351.1 peptidase U61 [Streptomyces abyssalis]